MSLPLGGLCAAPCSGLTGVIHERWAIDAMGAHMAAASLWKWGSSRLGAVLAGLTLMVTVAVQPAAAITFDRTDEGAVTAPSDGACPTIETPLPLEAWFNIEDMEKRGFYDPKNHAPWDFATKVAQVICGAKQDSQIKVGMFFIRAIGTMTDVSLGDRPESDPEVIYDALEYVKKNRGVKIGLVLDGGTITPRSAKSLINKRLLNIADLYWCDNGCFNTNAASVYPYAINHEKFVTISDTIWKNDVDGTHPAIISSSGNWARSQVRNYLQEVSLIYDDKKMFEQFSVRYDGMKHCASTGCSSSTGFKAPLSLRKDRGIWVDNFYRHYTDAGRGTTVSFSPQPSDVRDFYVQQFDDVDCAVDKKIRIAMFKLTDSKAQQMVEALVRVKKRGCDIRMLLTQQGGSTTISPTVVSLLSSAKIDTKCTPVAMHTKMILIGPQTNNNGRVLYGTANMSVSALRYSEEHVITLDTRRASPKYQEYIRRVYGEYMAGWYELSQGSKTCQ